MTDHSSLRFRLSLVKKACPLGRVEQSATSVVSGVGYRGTAAGVCFEDWPRLIVWKTRSVRYIDGRRTIFFGGAKSVDITTPDSFDVLRQAINNAWHDGRDCGEIIVNSHD